MLKDKRKIPLFIKTENGIYHSYFVKNGIHFCKGYHLVLEEEVLEKSYMEGDLK